MTRTVSERLRLAKEVLTIHRDENGGEDRCEKSCCSDEKMGTCLRKDLKPLQNKDCGLEDERQ